MTLPKAPDVINADLMTDEQIHEKLQKRYDMAGAVKEYVMHSICKVQEKRWRMDKYKVQITQEALQIWNSFIIIL